MARSPDPRQRTEGFRKAEASLRLEGMDPAGTPLYENIKGGLFPGISLTNRDGQKFWLITRSVRTATDTDRKLGTIASSKKTGVASLRPGFSCICYLFATCLLSVCYLFATATLCCEKSKAR